MGGESTEAWRSVLDDLIKRAACGGPITYRRRRAGARKGSCRRPGRRAGPALHGPQAQESARACARALILILGDAYSSWHHGQTTRRTRNYLKLNNDLTLDRCTVAGLEESVSPRVGTT